MIPIRLKQALNSAGIKAFRFYKTIGSTNDEAIIWAEEDAPDYSIVLADEQTKGKGRFDRRWITAPGSSLAFSLILKPNPSEIAQLPLFAPLCGLAVHDTLASLLGIDNEIKWPNDVLIQRKKCCGILVEATWAAGQVKALVLGIGINISPASIPPDNAQLFSATCLEDAKGMKVDRYLVLEHVLRQIKQWRPLLGTPTFFDQWQKYLAFKGEQVMIVQSEKQSIIGIEKGIDQQGNLILILDTDKEVSVEAGDVHLRPVAAASVTGGNDA